MDGLGSEVVIWTGGRHWGKTTAAVDLVGRTHAAGWHAAGIFSVAVHEDARLTGYDLVEAGGRGGRPLARRGRPVAGGGDEGVGDFLFLADGLAYGRGVLASERVLTADLVVVDEYGRLELAGGGWRSSVDRLVNDAAGVILLVVRRSLATETEQLYQRGWTATVEAGEAGAAAVLGLLERRKLKQCKVQK